MITSLDVFLKGQLNNSVALELSFGSDRLHPYIFSDDNIDIGIISLQSRWCKEILKTLIDGGYNPIPLSLIDSIGNNKVSDDILAIGFPSLSQIGRGINNTSAHLEQSNIIVAPIFTFGRIGMFYKQLPFFIADITIYPGNSGGPIIQDNNLIGIVSGQIKMRLDTDSDYYLDASQHLTARGTLAQIIKASNILPLLRNLQQREKYF